VAPAQLAAGADGPLEAQVGTAICDSDPLKLHYSWCLAWVGAAPWVRFEQELAQARQAFIHGELGFADLVLITVPDVATLRAQRSADSSRRRRSFQLHRTLREPLRAWYLAVDALEPGRVVWHLPAEGLPHLPGGPRARRTDPTRLDRLVDLLPTR